MKKNLTRNLFGEMVEEKPRKLCPYCGKGFIRLDLHLVFCPKNPDNKHPILNTIEEIPTQTELNDNKIIKIPLLNMKKLVFYPIEGRYWCKRKELNALHPEYKISRGQFKNLTEEKVEYYGCYWLEEGIDKDFIRMDRVEFRERFERVKKIYASKEGGEYVLLSVSGVLKTTTRSAKMKVILYGLIIQFTKYRLLKYEIESFWKRLQKTESPPELYYLCAAARQLDINKLEPQKKIGKFRGDLVIDDKFLIMIHSRRWHIDPGKQKIYEDTKRERYIQKEGYTCITFWSHEIFEDVEKCIRDTIEIINMCKKLK